MIRYRPNHSTLNASIKDEELFDSLDDMISFIHASWSRSVAYMGAKEPFRPDEIIINGFGKFNPMTGYKSEHRVLVRRMTDDVYDVPMCIGFCDFG